ncbi:MAG TPA: hypothetical protein VF600_08150, partial [Abditibacteriaceae bacterium]
MAKAGAILKPATATSRWRDSAAAGYTLSLLLHGTAYAALFVLASRLPAMKSVAAPTGATSTQESSQPAQQKQTRQEANALRGAVAELVATRQQLERIRDAKQKQLGQATQRLAATAPRT